MTPLDELLERAVATGKFDDAELERLLALEEPEEIHALFAAAYEVKRRCVGTMVHLRGLIEMGNYCRKDCYYCGVRKSNPAVRRFQLSKAEILADARLADEYRYGSIVLQSGERSDPEFVALVEELLREIKALPGAPGVTLSLGEQSREIYDRWRAAGADRYLLRIETSDPELYAKIHPPECRYEERRAAIRRLREAGYQTGTGVMVGLPGQTVRHLVRDVRFFQEIDIDMIGMGPWIPHFQTPMGKDVVFSEADAERNLLTGLKMIAVVRLVLRDVNIAASTALQALDPAHGRERGLLAGANVIMPNVGGVEHRRDYQLYEGKPGLDENAEKTRRALEESIAAVGEQIEYGVPGDPLHYHRRIAAVAEKNGRKE